MSTSSLRVVTVGLCFFASCVTEDTTVESQAITYSYLQSPGHEGASGSSTIDYGYGNVVGAVIADDIDLASGAQITQLTWWGDYFDYYGLANSSDNFTIQIHSDSNNLPGTILATYSVGSSATRTETGELATPWFCDEWECW